MLKDTGVAECSARNVMQFVLCVHFYMLNKGR